MPITPYATPDDLTAWDPDLVQPADVLSQLRSATILVARATGQSPYSTVVITDPLRDATCAQVDAWITTGIDPATGGLSTDKVIKAKAVDGGSVEYDTALSASVTAFQARQAIAAQLCAESLAILYAAGLYREALPTGFVPGCLDDFGFGTVVHIPATCDGAL